MGTTSKRVTTLTFIGFLMFIIGSVSLILTLVGLELFFLRWLNVFGQLGSFILKIVIAFSGIVIVIIGRSDEEAYDEYFDGEKYK